MKKTILLIFSMVMLSSVASFASTNADLFSFDENAMISQLAEVASIEDYVNNNQGVTLLDLKSEGLFANQLNLFSSNSFAALTAESPLGIPPFVWGFCLGVPGIAIVYFVAEDKDMTKKALLGCVVGGAVYTVLYFVFWGVLFASAVTTM
jgi:hypothetical protein